MFGSVFLIVAIDLQRFAQQPDLDLGQRRFEIERPFCVGCGGIGRPRIATRRAL
jgi:hypothetical protein